MADLVKKIVKGRPYWYARECRRVNGRVVTSWQRYLGSADHSAARLAQPASAPPTPSALHVCHAGHVHCISALLPSNHQELLAVPLRQYHEFPGREGWRVYRTQREIYGVRRTVVITHNVQLQDRQTQSLWRVAGNARRTLLELAGRLRQPRRGGPAPARERIAAQVARILAGRHMRTLFRTRIYESHGGWRVNFSFDRRAAERLITTLFGKTILVTDHHTWDTREIVEAYHAQYRIEDIFRLTKDGGGVAWFPQFHWTDQRIRVHAFYCMLALLLRGVLLRTLRAAGYTMPAETALAHLEGIAEVAHVYPDNQALLTTNTVTPVQRALYELFHLERWIAPLLGTTD